MKCPKCGTEFEGKFCPECGTPAPGSQPVNQTPVSQPAYQTPVPVQPAKKKGKGCLTAILIVVAVIVVIAIIASLGNKSEPAKLASGSPTKAASETKTSSAEQTVFSVNQAVAKNNVEMTVTNVKRSNGSEYDKPKSGMEFVIVTVKYKNTSKSDKISYNPYDFKIKNSKGQITDQAFTTVNSDTALESGDLAPGGEIEGTIAFEEPKGDKGLILQYTGNIFKIDSDIDFKLS